MAQPWVNFIDLIVDGNPANAGYTNQHINEIVQRTDYLKEQLDNLDPETGRILINGAALASVTSPGDIIYWDSSNNRFDLAIAEGMQDPDTGIFYATERAFAKGVVVSKTGATLGSVLLFGRYNFGDNSISVSGMIEDSSLEPFQPGRYYLSRRTPGKITRIPAAPLVQIGFFSETDSFIYPLQKDLFESHYHYTFPLSSKPSASQNFARTGWTDFGVVTPPVYWYVDYFNRGSSGVPPNMLLCIRRGSGAAVPAAEARVDIFRDGSNLMGATITYGAGLDYETPSSVGATSTTLSLPWPAYGEWVPITGSDLEIAFVRQDRDYTTHPTLSVDALADLTANTDRYKVFLPNDYAGWTNANPFDIGAPADAWFAYVVSGDENLNAVFPPVPASSAVLEMNGVAMVPNTDFSISTSGLFWMANLTQSPLTYAPWPPDYNSINPPIGTPAMDYQTYGKNIRLFYTRTIFSNSNSIVKSLRSNSAALRVTSCPDGAQASSGDLQMDLDLSLATDSQEDTTTNPFVFTGVSGVSLKKGKAVRRIVAGSGITLTSDYPGDTGVGAVTINAANVYAQGDIGSIALLNAKEVNHNNFFCVELLPPGTSKTAFVGKFTLPDINLPPIIKINTRGTVLGTTAVGVGVTRNVILRVMYHVIRPTLQASLLTEGVGLIDSNALMVRYWTIPLTAYTPLTFLSEVPVETDPVSFQLNPSSKNPNAAINAFSAPNNWLIPGDKLIMKVERVATNVVTSEVDDYGGRIGFANLRWAVVA